MKKLFLLLLAIPSVPLFSQSLEGINQEHLFNQNVSRQEMIDKLQVQKIVLKTGVELYYVEKGSKAGTPVIFLHGLSDSWHSFEGVFAHLPSTIRGFALTQRGHGNSGKPPNGYAPADFAADVAAFIEQKGLGRAIVVGHSMGGVNTQQFALTYPNLTKGIVIIDSDPALKNNPGMAEFYKDVAKMKGNITWQFMDEFQKSTLAKPIDSGYYKILVEEGMKTPMSVFQAALKGLLQVDFVPQLKNIQCPALVLWGDQDMICVRRGQDILVNNLKNARLVIYEGVGHALHWEEPKRFVNDLVQFIRSTHNVRNQQSVKE